VINNNLGLIIWHRLATISRNGLQGHPSLMIFISFDRAYDTSY